MQHKETLDVVKYAIRARICTKCWQRPPHSETLGPLVARKCEPHCTIFTNLAQLHTALLLAPACLSADEVMHHFICPTCRASPSAGDYCADGMTRTCPLSRYGEDLRQILEDVERTHVTHQ